jgi:pyruvate, water dikinase
MFVAGRQWLALRDARDPAVVGGKAARLGELLRLGVPVPAGWVLTCRARRPGHQDAMGVAVVAALRDAGYDAHARFAVRSSADTEDSARASFAGQFRTLLNVARDDVPEAVGTVDDSLGSGAVLTYSARLGIAPPQGMAVIVQEQVDAEIAGVCFTIHPVTGESELVLEWTHGLGEGIVGGSTADLGSRVFRRTDAGLAIEQDIPSARAATDRLTAVAELALRLELLLGCPQDVEWAVANGRVWILQARPISTLNRRGGELSEFGSHSMEIR